ncbi:hypothetical protein D3C75_985760 [compost metagenome]
MMMGILILGAHRFEQPEQVRVLRCLAHHGDEFMLNVQKRNFLLQPDLLEHLLGIIGSLFDGFGGDGFGLLPVFRETEIIHGDAVHTKQPQMLMVQYCSCGHQDHSCAGYDVMLQSLPCQLLQLRHLSQKNVQHSTISL